MPAQDAFDQLLAYAREHGCSDVHLKTGLPPVLRGPAGLEGLGEQPWKTQHLKELIELMLSKDKLDRFEADGELDVSYETELAGRARVNVYREQGRVALACRLVAAEPPELSALQFPESVRKFTEMMDGLVILAGPTGSGKSTTQAALLQIINQSRRAHILTIEDPIEFRLEADECMITQREVGPDTASFTGALRSVLRQDPDVIVIGECRDADSMQMALSAAETGHLVFTTLHTLSARETIGRILEFFPGTLSDQVRGILAGVLRGVVIQRMLPNVEGTGRVVAQEIMFNTPRVQDYIRGDDRVDLEEIMQEGKQFHGMQTLNQGLVDLVVAGRVSPDTALSYSANPQNLRLNLQAALGDHRI